MAGPDRTPLHGRCRVGCADRARAASAPDRVRARPADHGANGVRRAARAPAAVGSLDAATIAATDPADSKLSSGGRRQSIGSRVPWRSECGTRASTSRPSTTVTPSVSGRRQGDAKELQRRIPRPGFGDMKVKALGAVLAKRFGVAVAEPLAPSYPTLGDVDSAEALEAPGRKARRQEGPSRARSSAGANQKVARASESEAPRRHCLARRGKCAVHGVQVRAKTAEPHNVRDGPSITADASRRATADDSDEPAHTARPAAGRSAPWRSSAGACSRSRESSSGRVASPFRALGR